MTVGGDWEVLPMRAIAVSAFRAEPGPVEVPKPEPAAGEVRVKIEYAALNPHDWQSPDASWSAADRPVFPLVIGVDFAGRVDMIGSGDNPFRVGDPVLGRVGTAVRRAGTYCEYVCVPQDSPIVLSPRDLAPRDAAALPSAGMAAAQLLKAAAVRPGGRLLVIGAAGGVGSCLTQLAAARDVRVIAAVRGDERTRMGALGATATIDTTVWAGALEAAVRETCPDGVDALVDLVSTDPASFAAHAALVRRGGVALSSRGAAGPPTAPAGARCADFRLIPTAVLLSTLAKASASGALSVPIDVELPLEKAPRALAENRAGGARGKTLFVL
ncbi:NADPH:quinone reductase-like Zn-dependent oxidoreductase [Streptomyces fulvorobeus]|uniref:NADPH:quinone reductase-like Zn-dependent oxidoreductase n=1 Tax=Streptomyces fulvorobeus TaxID=284028 RepID=A0A7Y9HC22_9ACTN|nr:NADPH:quinone reductase-like Zn-dependent oxidoreductase [Streptomyces fulvorobeus]